MLFNYNLALTLLGQGNKKEAKILLTNVRNEECVEAEKAKDILSRMKLVDFFKFNLAFIKSTDQKHITI